MLAICEWRILADSRLSRRRFSGRLTDCYMRKSSLFVFGCQKFLSHVRFALLSCRPGDRIMTGTSRPKADIPCRYCRSVSAGKLHYFELRLVHDSGKAKLARRRGQKPVGPHFLREATGDSPKNTAPPGLNHVSNNQQGRIQCKSNRFWPFWP